MTTIARRLGYSLLERSLRSEFRRIVWLGEWPPQLPDAPVILYANHHAFYDGQVLSHLVERLLGRPVVIWMRDLPRFPFFKLLGALPFPADSTSTRSATIRLTKRAWRSEPRTTLVYFPEGQLHSWDDGLHWPGDGRMARLKSVMPEATWWPVALRVAGFEDHRPTAYLSGGPADPGSLGSERDKLEELLESLRHPERLTGRVLLEGRRGPHERWDFSFMNSLVSRRR